MLKEKEDVSWGSVDVVEPVDDVEKGEDGGEDHPGPLVDGVDVGQVGDGELQLRGASPQTTSLRRHVMFQRAASEGLSRESRLAVL